MIFIIDRVNHLLNESKMIIFAYNNDQMVYNRIVISLSNIGFIGSF